MKSKKKHTFKRRESLNKKGWATKETAQKKIDDFLVPRRKKKADDSKFMMMGCSDSYSCMPSSSVINNRVTPSAMRVRSRRRIDKLIGKAETPSGSRSRLTSIDMHAEDSFSDLRSIKRNKRRRLDLLKNDDFPMMFA